MTVFVIIILILIAGDMLELKKLHDKRRRDYIVYFALIALSVIGAWGVYEYVL